MSCPESGQDLTALLARLHATADAPIAGRWGAFTDYIHGRFTQDWYENMARQAAILSTRTNCDLNESVGDLHQSNVQEHQRRFYHILDGGAKVYAPWGYFMQKFEEMCRYNVSNENHRFRTYSNVCNIKEAWTEVKPMLVAYAKLKTTEDFFKQTFEKMKEEMTEYTTHYQNMDYTI